MRPSVALGIAGVVALSPLVPLRLEHLLPGHAPSTAEGRPAEVDEYEDLLRQAIEPWRDFKNRFEELANLSVSDEGGETVLRGAVKFYDVEASSFEARFAGPTQINSLRVQLSADPRRVRLRNDLSNNFAKDWQRLEDWLPDVMRDEKDSVLVREITVNFGPGNTVSDAGLRAGWSMGWRPFDALAVQMEGVELLFTVRDPANRQKAASVEATLSGDVRLGSSSARLSGTIQSHESREAWTFSSELEGGSLGGLLTAVVGGANVGALAIPAPLLDVGLETVTLTASQPERAVTVRGLTTLGQAEFRASQQGESRNATTSFVMGMQASEGARLSDAVPELALLDEIGLTRTSVIIASDATVADLAVFGDMGGQRVQKGLTIMGGYDIGAASPEVAGFLGVNTIVLRAGVAGSLSSLNLESSVTAPGGGIALVPNSDAAMLREYTISFSPDPAGAAMKIGALVDVKAGSQTLSFGADLGVDFTAGSIFIEGQLEAVDGNPQALWSNPFGIAEGLHLRNLGLLLGVNLRAPIPLPVLGLQGELVAGDPSAPDFSGYAVLGIDPGRPQNTVIDVGFSRLSLDDIVRAVSAPGVYQSIPAAMRNTVAGIALEDVRLSVVPSPSGADLFDVHYDPGFLVQGRSVIGSWSGELFVQVDYEQGITARASMDPIDASPWFALRGARGAPSPFIVVRLGPTEHLVAFGGMVTAMGLTGEADVLMFDGGFDFYLRGSLFDLFQAGIEVAGGDLSNGGSLYVKAEMENDLFRYITENASRAIDEATQDMQRDIGNAQNEVRTAQSSLDVNRRDLANYRAQKEQERDQVCLDIQNGSQDVARARGDLDAARLAVNSWQNDPGVIQARQDFEIADRDLQTAQANINAWQNDPGVIQARRDFEAADAELQRAIASVDSWQNDPGVLQARRDLDRAQADVNSLASQINAANAELGRLNNELSNTEGWRLDLIASLTAQIAAKGLEVGGLETARFTANGVLDAARATMDGSIRAGQETSRLGIEAARGTADVARATMDGTIRAGQETANFAVQVARETADAARVTMEESMRAAQSLAQAGLTAAEGSLYAAEATAQLAHDACVVVPIEVDPTLLGYMGAIEMANASFEVANGFLEGVKLGGTGVMTAADFIVTTGNPLSVLTIDYASFEGCMSGVQGGRVALAIRGSFAGEPIEGAMAFDFSSPLAAVEELAAYVLDTQRAPSASGGGGCQPPPFAGGARGRQGSRALEIPGLPSPSDLSGAPPLPAIQPRPAGANGRLPARAGRDD